MKSWEFYDEQYRKFGAYETGISKQLCVSDYPDKDPEKVFLENVFSLGDDHKDALDMGCGDGKFTLSLSSYYREVVGVEPSDMFLAATKLKAQSDVRNITFERQDASRTSFDDSSFDVVYSRRGPNPHEEIKRLLRPGGNFVFITIGESDAKGIKNVFGRGQDFGKKESVKADLVADLKSRGFRFDLAEDYLYDEYYFSVEALDRFLHGVPIFEDYDTEKDKHLLLEHTRGHSSEKGIVLPRHRVVIVANKVI